MSLASEGALVFDGVDSWSHLSDGIPLQRRMKASGQLCRQRRVTHQKLVDAPVPWKTDRSNPLAERRLREDLARLWVVTAQVRKGRDCGPMGWG